MRTTYPESERQHHEYGEHRGTVCAPGARVAIMAHEGVLQNNSQHRVQNLLRARVFLSGIEANRGTTQIPNTQSLAYRHPRS